MAALAAEHVRHPHLWPDGTEQCGHHRLAAARLDHMQHRKSADEHPLPPILAFDPHRGFVGADHRAGQHDLLDRRRGIQQRFSRASQDIADGPLADRQREEFVHQQDQPFHANGVGVMEIHHHRGDRFAEGRSRLQTGRRRGGDAIATTGATAAEQAHLGHIRANRGQLDALIDLLQGLRRVRKHRLAFRAGGQPPVDRAIRVRMQRPTDTGAALARRATCTRCREVWLVSLRGRPR